MDSMASSHWLVSLIVIIAAIKLLAPRKPVQDSVRLAIGAAPKPHGNVLRLIEELCTALPEAAFVRTEGIFEASVRSYWTIQAACTIPACIVKPKSSEDVAKAIKIISIGFEASRHTSDTILFAVRSGGHAPEATNANISGGITIDLSRLNNVEISEDHELVSIGPAARWGEVYEALEKYGRTVAGGRAGNVGVGGLTLGGGLSYFSPRKGFVCDQVVEYEVVLADGSIASVTKNRNANLWRALKGGGNNFGVVTKFVVRAFECDKIWTGYNYHFATTATSQRLLNAFCDFSRPDNFDEFSSAWLAAGYNSMLHATVMIDHVTSTDGQPNPRTLEPFMAAARVWSTVKLRTLHDTVQEQDRHQPPGIRTFWTTTTFENNRDMLLYSYATWQSFIKRVKSIKGMEWSLVFQALHPTTTSKSQDNVLGIKTDKTLIVVLATAIWKRERDDDLVHHSVRDLRLAIEARAKAMDIHNAYRYMNYASRDQDVTSGYSQKSVELLRAVSSKYDPSGLFQRGCIGGFKLFRVNEREGWFHHQGDKDSVFGS